MTHARHLDGIEQEARDEAEEEDEEQEEEYQKVSANRLKISELVNHEK